MEGKRHAHLQSICERRPGILELLTKHCVVPWSWKRSAGGNRRGNGGGGVSLLRERGDLLPQPLDLSLRLRMLCNERFMRGSADRVRVRWRRH